MSLWDKIITQNRIDSQLIRDLNDISYKSTKGRSEKGRGFRSGIVNLGEVPFLQTPPPDKITREMIEDYHRTAQGPLIDPTTRKPLAERYYPSQVQLDISDLQIPPSLVDFPPTGAPAEQADIDNYKAQNSVLYRNLKKEEEEYSILLDALAKEKDILNKTPTSPSGSAIAAQQKIIADIEKDIRIKRRDINKIVADIKSNKDLIRQAIENIEENKSIVITHNLQMNRELEAYRHSIMANNANRLNIEQQQPNESNEDYLQRMKDIETEQYDMDLFKGKADLEQVLMLKQNLRQLFSKEDLIENIIKSFNPEQQFVINKHFPEIAEYFLEIYGKNNSNLLLKDIVETITKLLERILNPPVEYQVEEEEVPSPASTTPEPVPIDFLNKVDASGKPLLDASGAPLPPDFKFGTDNNSLYIANEKLGTHVYFKIGIDPINKKPLLLYSTDENKLGGHFKQVQERESAGSNGDNLLRNIITKYLKLDAQAKKDILNNNTSKISSLVEFLEKGPCQIKPLDKGIKKIIHNINGKKYSRLGAGLGGLRDPAQELPAHAFFGNLVIMLSKLYYKNILSLKSKTGRSMEGLTNTKVSNHFVDIIMDMYANKDVSGLIIA